MNILEIIGLITGLLTVLFLINEKIINWFFGIIYIIISLFIFWEQQLYGDLFLHIIFLILNIYGWYNWIKGSISKKNKLSITQLNNTINIICIILSIMTTVIIGTGLSNINYFFPTLKPASLPYLDALTTSLSIVGMLLQAKKKIENWYYWITVDILSTGIYFYKGIYFYAILYFIYIGLAFIGLIKWKEIMSQEN